MPDISIKYMTLTSEQQNTEWCLHLSPALPLSLMWLHTHTFTEPEPECSRDILLPRENV